MYQRDPTKRLIGVWLKPSGVEFIDTLAGDSLSRAHVLRALLVLGKRHEKELRELLKEKK